MIYLDSCLVIYAVEPNDPLTEKVLAAMASVNDAFAVSPLVLMECLVGPIRSGHSTVVEAYDKFLTTVELIPLTAEVCREAAALRARTSLRTPDALHLAAALGGGCSALWTNDHRFAAAAEGFAVNVLSE